MPFTRSRVHQNWLPGYKGKLPVRGPLKHVVAHHDGTETAMPIAVLAFDDKLMIVRRVRSGTAIIDPWKAPYLTADAEADLATAATDAAVIDLAAGTSTDVSFTNPEQYPGPRGVRAGNYVYAVSFDAEDVIEEDSTFRKATSIVRWDGTSANDPTAYLYAPTASQDITLHYQRLFVLGGRPPNIVVNGDAEDDSTDEWAAVSNSTVDSVNTVAHRGTRSFKVQRVGGFGTGTVGVSEATGDGFSGATGNAPYYAQAYVYSATNIRSGEIQVEFNDAAGNLVGAAEDEPITTVVGAWTKVSVSGTTPNDTAKIYIRVSLDNVPESELHYIDDIYIACPGTIQHNTLYFSDVIGDTALTDLRTAWVDDTSGLLNQIVVDGNDKNDFGVGLARVGGNLVIFKRRSIHVLYGYSASTFQVKAYTREFGCIDPNSILEYDNGVVFMSQKGLMFFDGSDVTPLTSTIAQSYEDASGNSIGFVNDAVARNRDSSEPQSTIHVGALPGDFVMVNHQYVPVDTGSSQQPIWHGYANLKSGGWSKFSAPDVAAAPMFVVRTTNHSVLVTERDVFTADTFAAPEGDTSSDPRYFDEKRDATTWPISAKFRTKPINIGTPFHKSQLAQVAVDYAIHKTTSGDDNILALKIYEDQGTAVQTYTTIEASPALTDSHRTRWVQDVFDEMTSLALEVTTVFGSHDAGEPVEYAEIQQLHVAYQAPTYRRISD